MLLISQFTSQLVLLKSAGGRSTLVTWEGLDHQLDDSKARAELLSRSDAFLRAAFGM